MKTKFTLALLLGLISTIVIVSCQKSDLVEAGEDLTRKSKIVLVTKNTPIELAELIKLGFSSLL